MSRRANASLTLILLAAIVLAQQPADWSGWSKKEAERILNDSPWSQAQVETDASEMVYSPTTGSSGTTGNSKTRPAPVTMRSEQAERNANRAKEGAYNQAVSITYRIRLLSARPIREAMACLILLNQDQSSEEGKQRAGLIKAQMQQFIDGDYRDYIVVAVDFEAEDGRLTGKAFQDFNSVTAAQLKNNTYLERTDGERIYLLDYRPPIHDGLGARFVFSRIVNQRPFLNGDIRELRFYSEVGTFTKLNRRFKVSDMSYNGKLEY